MTAGDGVSGNRRFSSGEWALGQFVEPASVQDAWPVDTPFYVNQPLEVCIHGRETETLYWTGSLRETIDLARKVAFNHGADLFRIVECAEGGAELYRECWPFAAATADRVLS